MGLASLAEACRHELLEGLGSHHLVSLAALSCNNARYTPAHTEKELVLHGSACAHDGELMIQEPEYAGGFKFIKGVN